MRTGQPTGVYVGTETAPAPARRYVRIDELSAYTSLTVRHLHDLTRTGTIPNVRVGTVVLYDLFAIDSWLAGLASRAQTPRAGREPVGTARPAPVREAVVDERPDRSQYDQGPSGPDRSQHDQVPSGPADPEEARVESQ